MRVVCLSSSFVRPPPQPDARPHPFFPRQCQIFSVPTTPVGGVKPNVLGEPNLSFVGMSVGRSVPRGIWTRLH